MGRGGQHAAPWPTPRPPWPRLVPLFFAQHFFCLRQLVIGLFILSFVFFGVWPSEPMNCLFFSLWCARSSSSLVQRHRGLGPAWVAFATCCADSLFSSSMPGGPCSFCRCRSKRPSIESKKKSIKISIKRKVTIKIKTSYSGLQFFRMLECAIGFGPCGRCRDLFFFPSWAYFLSVGADRACAPTLPQSVGWQEVLANWTAYRISSGPPLWSATTEWPFFFQTFVAFFFSLSSRSRALFLSACLSRVRSPSSRRKRRAHKQRSRQIPYATISLSLTFYKKKHKQQHDVQPGKERKRPHKSLNKCRATPNRCGCGQGSSQPV